MTKIKIMQDNRLIKTVRSSFVPNIGECLWFLVGSSTEFLVVDSRIIDIIDDERFEITLMCK